MLNNMCIVSSTTFKKKLTSLKKIELHHFTVFKTLATLLPIS